VTTDCGCSCTEDCSTQSAAENPEDPEDWEGAEDPVAKGVAEPGEKPSAEDPEAVAVDCTHVDADRELPLPRDATIVGWPVVCPDAA
jgi:hypothetical protein